MTFRKSIKRKALNAEDDAVLRLFIKPVRRHTGTHLGFQLLHACHRTPHPHCLSQLFGLGAGKVRDHHRHAQQLFLKQRHAQRSTKRVFKQRMRIRHSFLALPAPHVRMHHLADDRTRPDDRNLHHNVIELRRAIAWQ